MVVTAEKSSEAGRVRVKVAGRVQGVYFRASACQKAQNLGLTGWVMNCPDGSVELVAEGVKDKLDELIAWCRHGPAGARVIEVNVRWENPAHEFYGFVIRH